LNTSKSNMIFLWIGLVLFAAVAINRTVKKGRPNGDEKE